MSADCQRKLADLVVRYEDVFSRHHLDCGEAKEFVHRIRLTDDRPFRLPYRCVLPAECLKLHQVLNEMEEKEIIRKSGSEFASPLVLERHPGTVRAGFQSPSPAQPEIGPEEVLASTEVREIPWAHN